MKEKKILGKVISGQHDNNIKFQDLRKLLLNYDFSERI